MAAVWVYQESSKAKSVQERLAYELDQRLGQRQGDLRLENTALFILHHRQAPAVRASVHRSTTGIMMLQPSGLLASTGGVRLRAWEGLPPVQRLCKADYGSAASTATVSPDCRIPGGGGRPDRPSDFCADDTPPLADYPALDYRSGSRAASC